MQRFGRLSVVVMLSVGALGVAPGASTVALAATGGGGGTDVVSWGNVLQYNGYMPTAGPTGAIAIVDDGGSYGGVLILKQDGTVVDWYDRSVFDRDNDVPNPPAGLTGVVKIASGRYGICLALKSNGTVVAWGSDVAGTAVPPGLSGVSDIAAGSGFAVALKSDGTVVAWGDHTHGQADVPAGLSGVTSIVTHGGYTVAIKSDGTVVDWGDGAPAVPAGLSNVVSVSPGDNFVLALKSDGTVAAWGTDTTGTAVPAGLTGVSSVTASRNDYGTGLGFAVKTDGTVVDWGLGAGCDASYLPGGLSNVVSLVTDGVIAAAIKSDSTTVSWGDTCYFWEYSAPSVAGVVALVLNGNYGYALTAQGDVFRSGANANSSDQPALRGATAIEAGGLSELVSMGDGSVVAWGDGRWGGTYLISDFTGITQVSTGGGLAFGRKSDGTVINLDQGDYQISDDPPAGLSGVTAIDAGGGLGNSYILARKSDGTVVSWGGTSWGQTAVPAGLTGVTAVSAGGYCALALESNSTVVGWGVNCPSVPTGLTGVTAIAAGGDFELALKSDKTVVAWGTNDKGQTSVPADLSNVAAIAAGADFALALKSDGTVVAWGNDDQGQIDIPAGLSNVTAITAADHFASALFTSAPATASIKVSGVSTPRFAGVTSAITVSVKDASGNLAYGYRGTVHFTSSDGSATLPTDYRFTGADRGTHVFLVTLATIGTRSVTATDAVVPSLTGSQTGIVVTSPTTPGAPTAARGAAANGSVVVSWTPPVSSGGRIVTSYMVTSAPEGKTCSTAATSCRVTGLANGQTYTFTVTATNSVGTGLPSTASAAVTLAVTSPGSPTSVTASAGNGSAVVSWTAPASNGGSAITAYTVTSSPDGKTCTTSATSCTVSGLTSGQPYTFTVTATNSAGTGPASNPSSSVTVNLIGATYHALTPTRILDSRDGYWIGLSGAFSSHVARTFQVTGRGGVPANATAVTGNLTVTGQTAAGFIYVGPNAANNPTSSTLNFPTGDDRANAVTVALGAGGTLSVTYAAPALGPTAQVIFDVTGYFTPDTSGATYHALTPTRVLDSRDGYAIGLAGAFSSHVARTFQVTGRGGVPANATAVTGNLTVTGQTAAGFLYVGPNAANDPTSSTLNFPTGDDRANAVTVALGAGGTLSATYAASTLGPTAQVIFDVTGYFTPDGSGAKYVPLTPARVLDSRDGYWIGLAGAFSSHAARTFAVGGNGGVPGNATAVTGNLTVTGQTALGFLYIGPNAMNNPTSSTLNFPVGDDRANAVAVALGAGGTLSPTYAASTTGPTAQVIFDVTGYFTP